MAVRNYLSNEYKDPMTTTRESKTDPAKPFLTKKAKPYSYGSFTDPTGPNPWVKWEAAVFEGDGADSRIVQTVGMHVCTELEWAVNFQKPAKKDATKVG